MSQHYRYNSQRSSQYQRQTNRSSYHNNNSGAGNSKQGYGSHYRERAYHDGEGYRNRGGREYEDEKYKSGREYRQSQRGTHAGYQQEEYNKYYGQQQQNNPSYKGRQQRMYSREATSQRRYQGQYSKNYQSRYEKRSRSRSRNKDQYYGQQVRDYGKSSGGYDNNKGYHRQSYSNAYAKNERSNYSTYAHSSIKNANQSQPQRHSPYKRNPRQFSFTLKHDTPHFTKQCQQPTKNIPYQKQHSRHGQQHSSKDEKRLEQSTTRNVISIEVKNRQRSPSPKDKKTRKSHSSRSKSRSVSKRSKEKGKRKRDKKHRSSSSSSHSSSYSSSSSSSSSNRSSSSSSSRSSSSSYSQSASSRKHNKHKEYKEFYNKNSSQQQRYSTQNYTNRQKYEQKYQSQRRAYENSTYGGVSKGGEGKGEREQREMVMKQSVSLKPSITQQNTHTVDDTSKPTPQDRKQPTDDKLTKNPQPSFPQPQDITNLQNSEKHISLLQVKAADNESKTQQVQGDRQYEQRELSFRKYNTVGSGRLSNEGSSLLCQQSYQSQRQYNSYSQYLNQQQQQQQQGQQQQQPVIIQQSQVVDKAPHSHETNAQLSLPSYSNRTYSADNQNISFGGENDYQKRNFMNQNIKRPYVNNYQNYPPRSMPYHSGFTNPPYQRYNQGFNANRPFEKNYYQNRNIEGQQQNLPFNNFNTPQNHFINQSAMPYQPSVPSQIRRATSQMVGQRKGSYFQQSQQNKDNELNRIQINKFQTDKEDLALIQQTFKKQSQLKKIHQLTPCSRTLQLIEKARQNLSIPAMKTNFLVLDLFKSMSDFRKQTMNSSLRSILQQDFQNRYNEQKSKVFENLRLLSLDDTEQKKQNPQKQHQNQAPQQQQIPTQFEQNQHECIKMDTEQNDNQNPQQHSRPIQFIWKKQQMSQTLRQLKSNIQMMRKASSSLSDLSRKIKVKELAN